MAESRQPAATIPCLICGYDLSGLPEEGVCPECAAPAGPSFRKNLFELTGTRHGRRVVRGLQLARDAAWAGLICFAAFILAATTDSVLLTLIGGGVVIAAPVFVAGWWIATGRGGSALRPEGLARPAKLARWSVVAVPVLYVFPLVAMAGLGSMVGGVPPVLFGVMPLALLLAMVVRVILTAEWIGCLATHLGDDDTPRRVRRRVRLAPILVVLFILLLAGAALARDFSSTGGLMNVIGTGASIAIGVAAFGTYAWLYIGLIHRGHRVARAALEAASQRENAAEDGGVA